MPSPLESFQRLWLMLAILNLTVSPLAMTVAVANMADTSIRDAIAIIPEVTRQTVFGNLWAVRLPLAALLVLFTAQRRNSRFAPAIVCGLSAAMLMIQSLASHAIDKGAFAVAIYFAHQVAAGIWIGALLALLVGAMHEHGGSRWLERATPRVSRLAGWSVGVLAVTGTITTWYELGWRIDLLLYSLYGRTLLWKLTTAGAVLLVGGYNRYRLVPATNEPSAHTILIRNVATECILLGAVLAWSVVLANTPPPH